MRLVGDADEEVVEPTAGVAKAQPKGKTGRADIALTMINKLYSIERELKEADDEQRFITRQEKSLPILG